MNSEWNENASRTRGLRKCRETNVCSGRIARSRTIDGTSAANDRADGNACCPAASSPSS